MTVTVMQSAAIPIWGYHAPVLMAMMEMARIAKVLYISLYLHIQGYLYITEPAYPSIVYG